ncbi:MAG: hypothetical protein WC789_10460 [Lentisphaeria bacterium]
MNARYAHSRHADDAPPDPVECFGCGSERDPDCEWCHGQDPELLAEQAREDAAVALAEALAFADCCDWTRW